MPSQPKYTDEDRPVPVSVRLPRGLYDAATRLASARRTSLSELLIEGLQMRIDSPQDPRDIVANADKDAWQELEKLIDARVASALSTGRDATEEAREKKQGAKKVNKETLLTPKKAAD